MMHRRTVRLHSTGKVQRLVNEREDAKLAIVAKGIRRAATRANYRPRKKAVVRTLKLRIERAWAANRAAKCGRIPRSQSTIAWRRTNALNAWITALLAEIDGTADEQYVATRVCNDFNGIMFGYRD